MKVYNYISIFLIVSITMFASCAQDEELNGDNVESLNGFQINVSDNGFQDLDVNKTRATENGYVTKFADGDAIGVFAVKGSTVVSDIENRMFTMVDGSWVLDGKAIEYKSSEFKSMKFYAYYPYNENVTFDANKNDPFETYVNNWKIGDDQSEGNYTKYDLMTSVGEVEGERLKGKVSFSMEHRMALAVIEKPQIVYDFTNEGIDDYVLKTDFTSFTLDGKATTPYYQESTDTYRFLVNPGKEYSIKSAYAGVKEMECEAKGTLEKGTAQLYKIEDPNKYIQELAVGDYFCADGSIVSKTTNTIPGNVIGIVFYAGNPQPSANPATKVTDTNDALKRDYLNCTHGLVMALNNTQTELSVMGSGNASYSDWIKNNVDLSGQYVLCNTKTPDTDYPGYMGYNNTALLIMAHESTPANYCTNSYDQMKAYQEAVPEPVTTSPWYIPSNSELNVIATNMAILNTSLSAAIGTELVSTEANATGSFYWSSTERNGNTQWVHGLEGGSYAVRRDLGSITGYLRLILAF